MPSGPSTTKKGLDERLEALGQGQWKNWKEILLDVLNKYNNLEKSSVTRMTAQEALKPQNEADVRTQLAIHAKHNRQYPPLEVGDVVRVFQKKKQFAKERVSTWEDGTRVVKEIKEEHGQKFYKVDNLDDWFIRSNLYRLPQERQPVKPRIIRAL